MMACKLLVAQLLEAWESSWSDVVKGQALSYDGVQVVGSTIGEGLSKEWF